MTLEQLISQKKNIGQELKQLKDDYEICFEKLNKIWFIYGDEYYVLLNELSEINEKREKLIKEKFEIKCKIRDTLNPTLH